MVILILALTGLAITLLACAGSLLLPLKRSPWPDVLTIGYAVLPVLAMTKLGAGRFETGEIVTQGILWGVATIVIPHTLRVKFAPCVIAKIRAKQESQTERKP
ncbi:hypothetical protein [Streptomyces sp. NPDC056188]|uniref:hypothetical protein n=1 Tax=Streptomyces sp. NPDC056188 TaxID=3345740 RepID=UPI0035DC4E9F